MKSISSDLYGPVPMYKDQPSITVSLHVVISDANENYAFSKFSINNNDYLRVNPNGYIRIKYALKDVSWEKHHQVIISQKNLFQLKLGLRKFYNLFSQNNLFDYNDAGKLVRCNASQNDDVIIELGNGQIIRFRPTIATDRFNVLYPGINITINREENQCILSIEEFEGLYDLISNFALFQASLSLLQIYTTLSKRPVEKIAESKTDEVMKNRPLKGKSLFDRDRPEEDKEVVITPPIKIKQPTTLEELM